MMNDENMIDQLLSQWDMINRKYDKHKSEFSGKGGLASIILHADKKLLELCQRLRIVSGEHNFAEYIQLNTEIVSYLKVLEQHNVLPSTGTSTGDIQRFERLQNKKQKAQSLIQRIDQEEARLKKLETNYTNAKTFLSSFYLTLKTDSGLNPVEVDRKLKDKSLKHEAYYEFGKVVGKEPREYLEQNDIKALIPEKTTSDKISGLDNMIIKYNAGCLYLSIAETFIKNVASSIKSMRTELSSTITPTELEDLERFKKGTHPTYNFGTYTANYGRTVMKNLITFFKESGIKNVTINF